MRQRGTIRTALTVFAASALLILPQMAQAAPSEEEIAAAKAAEEAASMSVAEIEVKLAEVNATAATATQNAQIAGEDLNEAQIALNAATATANKASADADAAEAAFQEGKQQIASVAQATYRNGGGSLDAIAPYLEADGLRGVEAKTGRHQLLLLVRRGEDAERSRPRTSRQGYPRRSKHRAR